MPGNEAIFVNTIDDPICLGISDDEAPGKLRKNMFH